MTGAGKKRLLWLTNQAGGIFPATGFLLAAPVLIREVKYFLIISYHIIAFSNDAAVAQIA
ncbi:hypothetical protein J4732_03060 [Serratia marcescens]|uniref:Uncharacterized protein n=1 Tax=Serratia marcescens TaxID=615 RepID=A0A939SNG9_SERMA|nr:hypothetical protein [Serratia marcescens]